jgi:hypothetical protein
MITFTNRAVADRSPEILLTEAAAVDGSSQTVSYCQPSGWTLNPASQLALIEKEREREHAYGRKNCLNKAFT